MDQAEIGKLYRLQTGETAKLLQKKPGGWKEFLIVSTSNGNGTLGLQEGEIFTSRVKEDLLVELGADGSAIPLGSGQTAAPAATNGIEKTARTLPSSSSLKRKAQKSKGSSSLNSGSGRRGGASNGKHRGLGRRGSGSDLRSSRGSEGLRTSSPGFDTSGRSLQNLVDVCHHVMEIEDTPGSAASSPTTLLSRSFDSMVTISPVEGLRTPPFTFSQPQSPLLAATNGGARVSPHSPTIPLLSSPSFGTQASPQLNGAPYRQANGTESTNNETVDVPMVDVSEEDILSVWAQQNAARVTLAELPSSILFQILAYLPIQALSRVEALNTTFRMLVGEVWRALIQRCADTHPKPLLVYYSPLRPAAVGQPPAMWKAAFLSETVRWKCEHCEQVFSGATNRNGVCKATVWGAVPLYNTQTHARNPASVLRLAATTPANITKPPML
mmetsp:Transcript_14465/g.56880  ORF Transcript_14465/g.56880 Transcript_14465/m.56880 type:complete len:441 (-) Transcript_14465:101-1423(-)